MSNLLDKILNLKFELSDLEIVKHDTDLYDVGFILKTEKSKFGLSENVMKIKDGWAVHSEAENLHITYDLENYFDFTEDEIDNMTVEETGALHEVVWDRLNTHFAKSDYNLFNFKESVTNELD